ncbi:MAG: hypothetical protein M3O34_10155 [Chloroflexota bacterium]|nr:hypothetical protein [Chloroflexota bacterium]
MLSAFGVLWRAVVHIWEESLLLIRANLTWFIGSLPLFLIVAFFASLLLASPDVEELPLALSGFVAGFVLLVVPNPLSVGVYALTGHLVYGETPEFEVFWRAIKRWWKLALAMFAIGSFLLGALLFNTSFYLTRTTGLWQAIGILWVYVIIYWITLQAYLLPLLVMSELQPLEDVDEGWSLDEPAAARPRPTPVPRPHREQATPSLLDLYKRAAILALAHPVFSLVLLLGTLLAMILSAVALPIYPLVAMAYVALVGSLGFRQLRQRYFPSEATGASE